MKPITPRQLRALYWPAWRDAQAALVAAHHTKEDAEAVRLQIHTDVTGSPCSSKTLTNPQLDQVLARFRSISHPSDGRFQARQADQPACRIRWRIARIQRRMGLSDEYVAAIAGKVTHRPLAHCDEDLARKILVALVYHLRRHPSEPAPQA